jgi:hypothetical protein
VKTEGYLSAARLYSLIVLLALFVDCSIMTTQAQRSDWLSAARQACLYELLSESEYSEQSDPVAYSSFYNHPHFVNVPGAGLGTITYEQTPNYTRWVLTVTRGYGGEILWVVSAHVVDIFSVPQKIKKTPPYALDELKDIAFELGLHVSDDSKFDTLFSDIERALTNQTVTVPGLETAFRDSTAPWVISALILILVTMIRNAVRRVLSDRNLAVEEPWMLLDGEEGIEKILSLSWLGTILLAPWIANVCLLIVFSSQTFATGIISSPTSFVLACCIAFVLELGGGWVSLTATSALIQLRNLRRCKLEESRSS